MEANWFAYVDGEIKGPFHDTELESLFHNWPHMFIWGQGLQQWIAPTQWKSLMTENPSSTRATKGAEPERKWRLKIDDHEMKDLTYDQMLDVLKTRDDYDAIRVWTEGYSDWRELFQIHQIADELGVSRRKHPRVPIMGGLTCEGPSGQFDLKALSISEGGLGATGSSGSLHIGDRLKIVLKSPNLFAPVNATAEVVYVGPDGYIGLKFLGIQIESKSSIVEYVRKFQEEQTQTGIRTS